MTAEEQPTTTQERGIFKDPQFWTTLTTIAANIAVVVGIVFGVIQFQEYKHEQSSKKYERILQLSDQFNSQEMLVTRSKAAAAYPRATPALIMIFRFFELRAREQKAGFLSMADFRYFFHDPALIYWCGWSTWVKEQRKWLAGDEIWSGYESLVRELDNPGRISCPSSSMVERLLELESYVPEEPSPGKDGT